MQLKFDDDKIYLKGDNERDATIIEAVKGWKTFKYNRNIGALEGPSDIDTLSRLASLFRLPDPLRKMLHDKKSLAERIDSERMNELPTPLADYPVKQKLFLHQIKAANMALLVFGVVEVVTNEDI